MREMHQKELAALRQELETDRAAEAARQRELLQAELRTAHENELAALRKSIEEAHAQRSQSLLAQFCQREEAWEKERAALLARIPQAAPPKAATPPPGKKPRRWLAWPLWAAVAAAAGTAGGLYRASGKDYRLPFSHPTALLWQREGLWAADGSKGAVYILRPGPRGLTVTERFLLPDTHIMGMAVDGDAVYIADSRKRDIHLWRRGAQGLRFETSWPSPGAGPGALFHDGKSLWSADSVERRIYQHASDELLSVLNVYDVRHTPVALFADAQDFWSADSESRSVCRHRWDPLLSPVDSYRLPEMQEGRQPLSAFTLRGREVWLAKDGSDRLYRRRLWRLRQVPLPYRSD